MQLEYAYAGDILKWDDNGDGTINVYGMATDPSVDLDGQGCDPEWLKAAMPAWFKFANIREQHSAVAAGVGKEMERADGDKWMLKSHIVDSGTVAKVKAGVLKGYSIGVRKGKVQRDKAAGYPNGRIVGGDIVEVSLVDRPCNPYATITIAKAAGGSDELGAVEPEFIDVDPTVYGETAVPSGDDDNGVADGEQDSQAVDESVDGDDDADVDPDDGVSLFDELDDELTKAHALNAGELFDLFDAAAEQHGEDIVKGLLESLIHGTKKPKAKRDGDGDGKIGDGENDAAKRAAAKKRREAEAERERKHHGAMDAEAMRDANSAQRQGRRQEADEHRGRLGSYRKSLELREYRSAAKLARLVLDGVITKSATPADSDEEIIAELAELVIVEASQIADGGYGGEPEDVSLLLDACAAIAKMAGAEPTILKAAGVAVDGSTAGAIVDVAEIVKAQVAEQLSEVMKAHEVETANLRAQVTKMAATPLPGGPFVGRLAMPSTPAQTPAIAKALELEAKAANPALAADVAESYRQLAALERAKG